MLRKMPWNFYFYLILGSAAFLVIICFGFAGRGTNGGGKPVANVHYIDRIGSNFLFRGGLPQSGHPPVFNYDGLKRAIIQAGKEAGVTVPTSFYIMDVNFLNIENQKDAEWIMVEQQFFQSNPTLGRIQVWGINGTGLHATDAVFDSNREYLAQNLDRWLNDKLTARVEILRGWLEGSSSVLTGMANEPLVIYIHCEAGCDRTGEFSGAYYLRYMNKSWADMNALNQSMCRNDRPFHCRNYRADQWYCIWLNLKRGFSLHWQQDFHCSGK